MRQILGIDFKGVLPSGTSQKTSHESIESPLNFESNKMVECLLCQRLGPLGFIQNDLPYGLRLLPLFRV